MAKEWPLNLFAQLFCFSLAKAKHFGVTAEKRTPRCFLKTPRVEPDFVFFLTIFLPERIEVFVNLNKEGVDVLESTPKLESGYS